MSTFVQWQLGPESDVYDTSPLHVGDGRLYDLPTELRSGAGTITVNERDRLLVQRLDDYWRLRRSGSVASGPVTFFEEPVIADITDPQPGDVLMHDENGRWVNAPPARSALAWGAKGDCSQTGTTITFAESATSGTVGTIPAALKVGHTLVVDGVGNLVVQGISGTTITFTTPAPAAASGAKFIFGTDNTDALNAWFAFLLANRTAGDLPPGSYLITNTVGRPTDDGSGINGLTVRCGGAELNSARLSQLGKLGGASLIWGGAAGGTMMKFSRVSHITWLGGLAFVGQPSHDPSGVFTLFGNRAGLGYHLAQSGLPYVGTGYNFFGQVVFSDITQGFQFGGETTDNNCDTTRFEQLIGWRCNTLGKIKHNQGLGYSVGFLHTLSCPQGIVFEDGGFFHCQEWNVSACDGSAGGTYQLEARGQTWGFTYKVDSLRLENGSAFILYVDSEASAIDIGTFIEGQAATAKKLFHVKNGYMRFGIAKLDSYSAAFGAGTRPFFLDAASSKTGQLIIDKLILTGPGGVVDNYSRYFEYATNCVNDVTVRSIRDHTGRTLLPINTKLVKGKVFLLGQTTGAGATVLTMAGAGVTNTFGFGPRVPKGCSVIDVVLIGDRADGFSRFWRRIVVERLTGNATIASTETIGTDDAEGTDGITIAVDTTTHVLRVSAAGTTGKTINWQATVDMRGSTNAADL